MCLEMPLGLLKDKIRFLYSIQTRETHITAASVEGDVPTERASKHDIAFWYTFLFTGRALIQGINIPQ